MSNHLDFSDKDFTLLADSLNKIIHFALSKVEQSIEVTPDDYNKMIDNLIDYIYSKERIYYNQDSDSATIYTGLIAACYVSKASFFFWYNAANDTTNPWHNYLVKNKRPLGGIWNAIKVAAADTWGFLTGGWHIGHFNPDDNSWPVEWHIDEAIDNAGEKSSSV